MGKTDAYTAYADYRRFSAIVILSSLASLLMHPVGSHAEVRDARKEMQMPLHNPFYSDATASTMHGGAGYGRLSRVPGPRNVKRPLKEGEVVWQPAELADWTLTYSSPYPDGRRVMWVGGGKVLHKLDADTLKPLATLKVREGHAMTADEIEAHIKKLDGMDGKEYYKLAVDTMLPDMGKAAAAAYKVVSNENELYMLAFDTASRKSYLRVYGDAVKDDPDSAIELKREWALPKVTAVEPFGFSVNLTYDGRVIVATMDGVLYSVSRDLKEFDQLILPHPEEAADPTSDTFKASNAFVRNATPVDPEGGIYVVTRTDMHRVQWTGKKLSLKPEDGAWSVPYAGGALGSGTSPALMGWGDKEDRLVIIGDGRPNGKMHLLAFWRDRIPADWTGIKGMDRRVAGIALIDFGKHTPKKGTIENSLPVKGYGVLVSNDWSPIQPEYEGSVEEKLFAHYYAVGKHPDYVPRGALRYNWNPAERKLELAWKTDLSLTTSIPVIDIKDTVYAIGSRDGIFTMEALDWNTGKPKFYYNLGKSIRFSPNGSSVMVAPNGALDCYCQGGGGIVRIHPE